MLPTRCLRGRRLQVNFLVELCKLVFQLHQQGDESIDSWIARSNAHWSRLLQKGVTLAEFQAYILLRHSKVDSDDKRKLLIESGENLSLEDVRNALRKLGAKFVGQMLGKNFVEPDEPQEP